MTPTLSSLVALKCLWVPSVQREYINGLVQDCSNSSALAKELLQSCTKPLIYIIYIANPSHSCFGTRMHPLHSKPLIKNWLDLNVSYHHSTNHIKQIFTLKQAFSIGTGWCVSSGHETCHLAKCISNLNVISGIDQQCSEIVPNLKHFYMFLNATLIWTSDMPACLHPANERLRYKVTPSLIGWVQS